MNLNLNNDWDLDISDNELQTVEGREEITQLVAQRLKTFYGEWFLDTTIGIPYFQTILKKNPNPYTIESIFTKEIIETDGIIELTKIDLDMDSSLRTMEVTFEAQSSDGVIEFTVPIGG